MSTEPDSNPPLREAYRADRRPWWVLLVHAVGVVLIQSTAFSLFFNLPMLVRNHFQAGYWGTTVITAAPTILFVSGIFWNDVFRRTGLGRYLAVYWLVASLPLLMAFSVSGFWSLLPLHLLASVGAAGYHPAAGELIKHLYPDSSRGRAFSVLSASNMLCTGLLGYAVGRLLAHDPDSYRWFMPLAAVYQAIGLCIFLFLARWSGMLAGRSGRTGTARATWADWRLGRVIDPVVHMGQVLRGDRIFARYEGAFMTYGVGWMVCTALIPLLATSLHLEYDVIAGSTQLPYYIMLVTTLVPCGLLMDRIGPTRLSGLSFLFLALYPLALIGADGPSRLVIASLIYGIAHSGTTLGWTLGPVSLAPDPGRVPQYVAIHATLVGLRGAVFQFAGVGLYTMTGSFTWPLLFAAAAFLWGSWQMYRLDGLMRSAHRAPSRTAAEPVEEEALVEHG